MRSPSAVTPLITTPARTQHASQHRHTKMIRLPQPAWATAMRKLADVASMMMTAMTALFVLGQAPAAQL